MASDTQPDDDFIYPSDKGKDDFIYPHDEQAKPEVGGLEAAGRGAAQMFGLGYSPQLIAAATTGHMPGSSSPEYEAELQRQKRATEAAWEQHPWAYGGGMAAAVAPAVVNAIFAGPEEAAAGAAGAGLAGFWNGMSSLGSLTGFGLRTAASGSSGALPALARVGAGIAENPVVQGAIYGSSQGEGLHDKFMGALEGAAGAKVFPWLLNKTGSAVSGTAKYIGDKFFNAIGGTPSSAQVAADAAHALGSTLPLGAVTTNPWRQVAAKTDPFAATAEASKSVQSHMQNILETSAGEFTPASGGAEKAGDSIKNGYLSWLKDETPSGFRGQMNDIYSPIKSLSASESRFDATRLKQAVTDILSSPKAEVRDIQPTLDVVNRALQSNEQNNGLTFQGLRDLRGVISDTMDHSHLPGAQPVDNDILNKLRLAVSGDMTNAAYSIGGEKAVKGLSDADRQASQLYQLRDILSKRLGNFKPDSPNAKPGAALYQNLAAMAAAQGRGGDLATLGRFKSILPSEVWDDFQKAYVGNNLLNPRGFSFDNFANKYGSMSDGAKDLIFGAPGSSVRNNLETMATLGRHAGDRLDKLASRATSQDPLVTGGLIAIASQLFAQGISPKAIPALTATAAYGRGAAKNVAAPMLPSPVQELWNALGTTPEQRAGWATQVAKTISPLTRGTQTASRLAAPVAGAAAASSPEAQDWWKAGGNLLGVTAGQKLYDIFGPGHATGGRIERASGGRAGINHKEAAESLIRAAERAKKAQNETTEPLLNLPDEAITRALATANEAI